MASSSSQITLQNTHEPDTPLTIITINNAIKLTSTNYLSWKLQLESILIGHDVFKYIDGSYPAPPATITVDNETTPNPGYLTWFRQDKLLFGAIVGTLSPTLVPLITNASTSQAAWETLSHTFARPTRGHIKQLRDNFKAAVKGSLTVSEYLQSIKIKADELSILGKPMDHDDLIEQILDGLDDTYRPVIEAINSRDTPINFDELHEKLLNHEISLRRSIAAAGIPITAHFSNSQRHSSPR